MATLLQNTKSASMLKIFKLNNVRQFKSYPVVCGQHFKVFESSRATHREKKSRRGLPLYKIVKYN